MSKEDILKRFFGKHKANGKMVAVNLEDGGASIASINRSDGLPIPVLDEVIWAPFSSVEERQEALEKTIRNHNLQKSSCVSVLSPDFYQLVQVEMASLSPEESRDAARWQIRERIDYPPEEAIIDLFEVAPFGSEKKPVSYAVSARENILRDHVDLLKRVGLELETIDIPEFSLRNICDLFTEDPRGLAILLLLEKRGILVVVRDGSLYLVRILSMGMNDLIPYADGQHETLTDRLDGIVLETQRSFDYCESTFHLPMVSRLLVAQTQQEVPELIGYLQKYLATTVETFSFAGVLKVPEGVGQIELNRHLLAIGGALRKESN
jgi:MSHA biogenesis protein MshI